MALLSLPDTEHGASATAWGTGWCVAAMLEGRDMSEYIRQLGL